MANKKVYKKVSAMKFSALDKKLHGRGKPMVIGGKYKKSYRGRKYKKRGYKRRSYKKKKRSKANRSFKKMSTAESIKKWGAFIKKVSRKDASAFEKAHARNMAWMDEVNRNRAMDADIDAHFEGRSMFDEATPEMFTSNGSSGGGGPGRKRSGSLEESDSKRFGSMMDSTSYYPGTPLF